MNKETTALRRLRTELKVALATSQNASIISRLKAVLEPFRRFSEFSEIHAEFRKSLRAIERYLRAQEWGSAKYEIRRMLIFVNGLLEELILPPQSNSAQLNIGDDMA